MLQRAYSVLEIKEFDDDKRVITGIATTPSPDRLGDIVEPLGVEYDLPIPLLMGHDSRAPIGHVTEAKVTKNGIRITAKLVKVDAPASLAERLDEAWSLLKSGLVRGLSIGFRAVESSLIEGTFSFRFIKWQWLELSAVVIPANADASISTVKGIDNFAAACGGSNIMWTIGREAKCDLVRLGIDCLNDRSNIHVDDQSQAALGKTVEGVSIPGASGSKPKTVNLRQVRNRDGTFRTNPGFRG